MKKSESELHKAIVSTRIGNLKKAGHTILGADYTGYPQVEEISGKRPDILSKAPDGVKVITEAETCESIDLDQTKEQFKAFSSARNNHTEFHVAIPGSCLERAEENASRWGVSVDQWWYKKDY